MSEVEELVGFIGVGVNEQIARPALEIVEGLTGSDDGTVALRSVAPELANNLLLCVSRPTLCQPALASLVNLSQDDVHCRGLIEKNACTRLMTYLVEGKTTAHDYIVMALSNLTRGPTGVSQALQSGQDALECSLMRKLLNITMRTGSSDVMYEHAAGIVCNITQQATGRRLLLESDLYGFRAIVDMLQSKSATKRSGSAAAIKNMILAASEDGWFAQLVDSQDILTKLLVPINGEVPVEEEASVRENVAQCIAVIASDDAGRQALFDVGAQDIVKKGYEYEEHPGVMEAMECIGRLFMGVSEPSQDVEPADSIVMLG